MHMKINFNSWVDIFKNSNNAANGTAIQVLDENLEYLEKETLAAVKEYNEMIRQLTEKYSS